jgi:hypothetical protein
MLDSKGNEKKGFFDRLNDLLKIVSIISTVALPLKKLLAQNGLIMKSHIIANAGKKPDKMEPWFLKQISKNKKIVVLSLLLAYSPTVYYSYRLMNNKRITTGKAMVKKNYYNGDYAKALRILALIPQDEKVKDQATSIVIAVLWSVMFLNILVFMHPLVYKQRKLIKLTKAAGLWYNDKPPTALYTPVGCLISITGHEADVVSKNDAIWSSLNIKIKSYKEYNRDRSLVFFSQEFKLADKYIYSFNKLNNNEIGLPLSERIADFLDFILQKIYIAKAAPKDFNFSYYLDQLQKGYFKDKFVMGISDFKRDFHMVDMVDSPGACFIGGMGSGKTWGSKFSSGTVLAASSENTFLIMCDPEKNLNDYMVFYGDDLEIVLENGQVLKSGPSGEFKVNGIKIGSFELRVGDVLSDGPNKGGKIKEIKRTKFCENVVASRKGVRNIANMIDMVYEETKERSAYFDKLNAKDIKDYNQKMKNRGGKQASTVYLIIEEFSFIPQDPVFEYHQNEGDLETPAGRLSYLMRVGRSYGINLVLATQRATSDHIPSSIKTGLKSVLGFRVNSPTDAAYLEMACDKINSSLNGRCLYEDGSMQFPGMDDQTIEQVIRKYRKPFNATLFKYQPDDYRRVLSGGVDGGGVVWIKPLKTILTNIKQYGHKDSAARFLHEFGFKSEKQTNDALVVSLIAEKGGNKYAVMVLGGQGNDHSTEKGVIALEEGMKALGLSKLIVMSMPSSEGGYSKRSGSVSGSSVPQKLVTLVKRLGGYLVDTEDLVRIAEVLDNRKSLEETGQFATLQQGLALNRPELSGSKKEGSSELDQNFMDDDDDESLA